MICPKCKAPMDPVNYGGIEIDRCSACKGLWFDGSELTHLKAMPGSQIIDTGSPAIGKKMNAIDRISCPRCQTPMIRMVDIDQPHVWFESCTICKGVYLDAGEFKDLKHRTPLDYLRDLFSKERKF